MSEAVRVERTVVILPAAVWRHELEAELIRLGIDPSKAPRATRHVLHRIVGHAGWHSAFLVADDADAVLDTGPTVFVDGEI